MEDTAPDFYIPLCVEPANRTGSDIKEIYEPFGRSVVTACINAGGGEACYSNRWAGAFYDVLTYFSR